MTALSVFAPRRFARLMLSDAISIRRDPMLILVMVLSTLPAIGFLAGRDAMNALALRELGLERFDRYVAPVALLVPAFLVGWVTGFLILEDRDEGPLLALDVTPVGKIGFLCYRVAVTVLVVAMLTGAATTVIVPDLEIAARGAVTMLVAGAAVLAAIVLPALARNKVEGLALTKLTNIASVVPLLAIIPSPWRHLGGIIPTYWLGELLELSRAQYLSVPGVLVGAVVSHVLWAARLLVILRRRVG